MEIARVQAGRLHRRAGLLDLPASTVSDARAHCGYIQIDPINGCGRMHELIERNRVAGYREGDRMWHLQGGGPPLAAEARVALEHHLPSTGSLVAFGLDAWPHPLAAMGARPNRTSAWSDRLSPRQNPLGDRIRRK